MTTTEAGRDAAAEASRGSARPLLLVVDDEVSGAEALGILLEQAGYDTRMVHSGAEALEAAAQAAPDLVLLDMMMPHMDGLQTCAQLHALPGLAEVPVIFLTGSADRSSVAAAFRTGARDYVTKPFVIEELLARVRTHVDLKRARDRMERMLKEREEITHVVAHDLKNPLTCVLFAAQSLRKPTNTPERSAELAGEIVDCARFAMEFIQRFLARGAEGQRLRQFSARRISLIEIARSAVQVQRTAGEVSEVSLRVSGEESTVNADPDVTRNVLLNLISNAIHYSPRGCVVEVDVGAACNGFAQCRVMDRGPGVAPKDQAKLFTRFLSVAAASERAKYSSGLGLAIAKHDVAQMGGLLWYQPRDGGGSVFGFDLPAA